MHLLAKKGEIKLKEKHNICQYCGNKINSDEIHSEGVCIHQKGVEIRNDKVIQSTDFDDLHEDINLIDAADLLERVDDIEFLQAVIDYLQAKVEHIEKRKKLQKSYKESHSSCMDALPKHNFKVD